MILALDPQLPYHWVLQWSTSLWWRIIEGLQQAPLFLGPGLDPLA